MIIVNSVLIPVQREPHGPPERPLRFEKGIKFEIQPMASGLYRFIVKPQKASDPEVAWFINNQSYAALMQNSATGVEQDRF